MTDPKKIPHNFDAEANVLACALAHPDFLATTLAALDGVEAPFFHQEHAEIWDAMVAMLHKKVAVVDIQTLHTHLIQTNRIDAIGGPLTLVNLSNRCVVPQSGGQHSLTIIRDAAILRAACNKMRGVLNTDWSQTPNALSVIDVACADLWKLSQVATVEKTMSSGIEAYDEVVELANEIVEGRHAKSIIPSGFPSIDGCIHGFIGGRLYLIAGRTGLGKTAFALNLLTDIAVRRNTPVLIWSLEMSRAELMKRITGMVSGVDWNQMHDGIDIRSNMSRLTGMRGQVQRAPIAIEDSASASVMEIVTRSKKWVSHHKRGVIIVDYVGLVKPLAGLKDRHLEIGHITRSLKELSRETQCPVIALTQLSRDAENESNGFKMLRYLRESGSQEQDSDVVMILCKPDDSLLGGIKGRYPVLTDEETKDIIVCTVAKNRHGRTDTCPLVFKKDIQKIIDIKSLVTTPTSYTHSEEYEEEEVMF